MGGRYEELRAATSKMKCLLASLSPPTQPSPNYLLQNEMIFGTHE